MMEGRDEAGRPEGQRTGSEVDWRVGDATAGVFNLDSATIATGARLLFLLLMLLP